MDQDAGAEAMPPRKRARARLASERLGAGSLQLWPCEVGWHRSWSSKEEGILACGTIPSAIEAVAGGPAAMVGTINGWTVDGGSTPARGERTSVPVAPTPQLQPVGLTTRSSMTDAATSGHSSCSTQIAAPWVHRCQLAAAGGSCGATPAAALPVAPVATPSTSSSCSGRSHSTGCSAAVMCRPTAQLHQLERWLPLASSASSELHTAAADSGVHPRRLLSHQEQLGSSYTTPNGHIFTAAEHAQHAPLAPQLQLVPVRLLHVLSPASLAGLQQQCGQQALHAYCSGWRGAGVHVQQLPLQQPLGRLEEGLGSTSCSNCSTSPCSCASRSCTATWSSCSGTLQQLPRPATQAPLGPSSLAAAWHSQQGQLQQTVWAGPAARGVLTPQLQCAAPGQAALQLPYSYPRGVESPRPLSMSWRLPRDLPSCSSASIEQVMAASAGALGCTQQSTLRLALHCWRRIQALSPSPDCWMDMAPVGAVTARQCERGGCAGEEVERGAAVVLVWVASKCEEPRADVAKASHVSALMPLPLGALGAPAVRCLELTVMELLAWGVYTGWSGP